MSRATTGDLSIGAGPSRPRPRRTAAPRLLVFLLIAAAPVAVRGQSPAGTGSYRITGKVVSAETGTPLSRAEVAIAPSEDAGAQDSQPRGRRRPSLALQSVTTGEDGRFVFDHIPAGKYSLGGGRRGFITANYQQHGLYFTSVVTGAGLDSENLVLKLSAGAVIAGSVDDVSGDPVGQTTVTLYRLNDDGLGTIQTYRSKSADDQGGYEFAHLPPGTYFLSAAARVWYATPAQPSTAAPLAVPASPINLDVVYPRVYYADAADSASATPIPVRGGEHLRVQLAVHATPAIHLSYSLPGLPGDGRSGITRFHDSSLSESIFGSFEPGASSNTSMRVDEQGRQNWTLSVPPGEYQLQIGGRALDVSATGDAVLDPQSGPANVTITASVGGAPGITLPTDVQLFLQPANGHRTTASASRGRDGSFTFDQVAPGDYELIAQSDGQSLAVIQMAAGGAPLEGHVVKVNQQPVALAATLAPASSEIRGFVHLASPRQDQPAQGAMIVLVPQHTEDHELYRRDQSDSDGSFVLRQVPAGKYTLVAIDNGWDLDWARPGVISHYLAAGASVQVNGATRDVVRVTKPLIVQSR